MNKYGIDVRFVEESDAEFILSLRTDPKLSRYLHATDNDVEKQRQWIRKYKEREAHGKEYYFMYIKNENLAYRRDLERNQGNPIQIKLLISENSINIYTIPNKNTSLEFVNIERVIKTKNYYIFISKAKLWVAVKKEAFSKGTLKEFEEFLKKKKL